MKLTVFKFYVMWMQIKGDYSLTHAKNPTAFSAINVFLFLKTLFLFHIISLCGLQHSIKE